VHYIHDTPCVLTNPHEIKAKFLFPSHTGCILPYWVWAEDMSTIMESSVGSASRYPSLPCSCPLCLVWTPRHSALFRSHLTAM
jgi:hypothetical protein